MVLPLVGWRLPAPQRRFWAFSMNAKLKLPEMFGLLRPGFLLLLRRSRFVGEEIQF